MAWHDPWPSHIVWYLWSVSPAYLCLAEFRVPDCQQLWPVVVRAALKKILTVSTGQFLQFLWASASAQLISAAVAVTALWWRQQRRGEERRGEAHNSTGQTSQTWQSSSALARAFIFYSLWAWVNGKLLGALYFLYLSQKYLKIWEFVME